MIIGLMADLIMMDKYKYNTNGFDINGKHKETKDKHDPNGFDINGKH